MQKNNDAVQLQKWKVFALWAKYVYGNSDGYRMDHRSSLLKQDLRHYIFFMFENAE